jgi:hypothetical protein
LTVGPEHLTIRQYYEYVFSIVNTPRGES